ncbi:hypothetical protein SAMN02746041_00695 [Desulfacinum hydrothermale DSM 13146]|uniref:Type IV pilus assembly protein PilY1 n=1 Tax=Desulfacinum hydrothermale DSM 13146 TaxID=1121390 RepID=A0A1W1X6Q2_9BACT|nr:hypothetical protein [Desulfacinum hydrothermale]SMC19507.1 hypothetical protein SAMN02746041_00695 [Desulfacinum hydrothermale DSM 13146]
MKIRRLVVCLLVCFMMGFAPWARAGTCDCAVPPFIAAGVKANVLIILDNSNSMDEDFYGNAVGSYSPVSKSVVARKALIDMIDQLKDELRVGLMTYRLSSSGVVSRRLHNSQYFASYDPRSYCPDPPDACVEYCRTGDGSKKTECENACRADNGSFDADYFDSIISSNSIGSEIRDRYCALVYPKTQAIPNPADPSNHIYYKGAFPFYSGSNLGTAFCISWGEFYHADDGPPWDWYKCYGNKSGTSDDATGYWNFLFDSYFTPTDTDYALGYADFGQRMTWYYVGRTWFNNSSPGDGYLHVPVGDLEDLDGDTTDTYTDLLDKLDPKENDASAYMSCSKGNKNDCDYVINAGLTPTAGTLQDAYDYFLGSDSPIQERCQKNFVVYVTDGLPSVDEHGNEDTADNLMPAVLQKIDNLRHLTKTLGGTDYTFDVRTYVLGVGLTEAAKAKLDEMAVRGGTDVSGRAYYADNPTEMTDALTGIFADILKKTASGTSVSILSERAQKGANVMQAVFYPEKQFGIQSVNWVGFLYNYWFYVSRGISNLREDTVQDQVLDLGDDYVISFKFENGDLKLLRYEDTNGDGEPDAQPLIDANVTLDELKPIWEAGKELFQMSSHERKIYTVNDSDRLVLFNDDNVTSMLSFSSLFGDPASFDTCLAGSDDNVTSANLVNYVRGDDRSGCRNRTVTLGTTTSTWKLGDIVYSTPKVAADYTLCSNDSTRVCETDADCTGGGSCDKVEGVVFFGANDGMLHAVKTGVLTKSGLAGDRVAKLEGTDLGKELWAFVPKNSLPYLRCLARNDYCHLYYVDLSPYIVDMGNKKVLIGGMRLGGGVCEKSKGNNYTCDAPSDTCSGTISCPNADTCYNPSNCVGLSAYFALDITHPEDPKFLWEFTHPKLGYSYSGPAVVHRDGNYYVIFASGPQDRKGDSEQNLHTFVLSLDSDLQIADVYVHDFGKSFKNAFGGRLFTTGLDLNEDGNTDFVFFGYGYSPSGKIDDWKGGIVKLWTGDTDPTKWDYNTNYFNAAQQPITAKVEFSKCFGTWYVYAGSGRYFFKEDNYSASQNDRIMAVPFVCDADNNCAQPNINFGHSSAEVCSHLGDLNGIKGWYIELNGPEDGYFKERMISDPTVTDQNLVFFTTTEPTADICGYSGRTRIWGLNCATGEAIADLTCPGYGINAVQGSLFLQTSTGALYRVDPNSDFSTGNGDDPKTNNWVQGVPPESATPFVPPFGVKTGKILHWIEK